ncbi:transposase, IS4 family [Ancylostoma caninum]|uniref:Transposase, IS4 family n=1 Tax=Ancylostoma caninum TaxID=29170 RepID=A0A368FJV0_ANCCA|nr:transposase, IS4 family [Ancylostoma caninum]
MYPAEFEGLYRRIAHKLEHRRTHVSPITGRQRLAILCRFLGHGSSFSYMALELSAGTSTVMETVYEVCKAIIDEYFYETFPLPTGSTWAQSAREFQALWGYPRAVAALDGKHFECFRPRKSGSSFYNYKGYYSVVLLALCDAQYRILMFDLGKSSDAGIYMQSPMRSFIEDHLSDFPPAASLDGFGAVSYHILVDQGFAQAVHMQRPFNRLQAESDSGVAHFNKCFSRARRVVENLFGILVSRFRLFLHPIHATQKHVKMLILTAMILHNILVKSVPARVMRYRYLELEPEEQEQEEQPQVENDPHHIRAKREREILV